MLLKANLISIATFHLMNSLTNSTSDAQNYYIIGDLLHAVALNPKNFYKLLHVLERIPPVLRSVAAKMREDCYSKFWC